MILTCGYNVDSGQAFGRVRANHSNEDHMTPYSNLDAAPTRGPLTMRHGFRTGEGSSYSRAALSDEQIRRAAPSVFAEQPWGQLTNKYLFIPTAQIVASMRREGFEVVQALQGQVRTEGKEGFTKHLLRFALPKADQVHESVPELVLINSHDGTAAYRLMLGVFRLICRNGLLMATDVVADLKFRHSRSLAEQIIEGTGTLVREVPRVHDQIERLSGISLQAEETQAFAKAAHALRWEAGHAPVTPDQLLNVRRDGDRRGDLYTTLNVVQENIIRGGLSGRTRSNRNTSTRAVKGVSENVRLNEGLAVLANEMARLKTTH